MLVNIINHAFLRLRSILTPTNAIVNEINDYIFDLMTGTTHTYYSQDLLSDNVCEDNNFEVAFPVKYLNSINMPCIPKHELRLKVGVVIMLMSNLN